MRIRILIVSIALVAVLELGGFIGVCIVLGLVIARVVTYGHAPRSAAVATAPIGPQYRLWLLGTISFAVAELLFLPFSRWPGGAEHLGMALFSPFFGSIAYALNSFMPARDET